MCPALSVGLSPQFGGYTFFARSHPGELCGTNGLPLTPNLITIIGRAQFLKTIKHPNLCSYLDIIRAKHERTVVVAQHHTRAVSNEYLNCRTLLKIAKQTLEALNELNKFGIIHRSLCPDNMLLNENNDVQLFNYGLYYMTGGGSDVSFPIGHPKYISPEVLLCGRAGRSGPKCDVWSLGIILAEQVLGRPLWHDLKLALCLRKVLSLVHSQGTVIERLAREHGCMDKIVDLPSDLRKLIDSCLDVNPRKRPTPQELLQSDVFNTLEISRNVYVNKSLYHPLLQRELQELYYMWQLAGGDAQAELKKQGLIRSKAPILSIPNLILLEGTLFGQVKDLTSMLDLRVVPLSLDTLAQRLEHLPINSFYPLVEIKSLIIKTEETLEAASLPLVIRERNTEYQFHRVVLYDRLLKGYPYKKLAIQEEAAKDVPPLHRGNIWAALLGIAGDVQGHYEAIDKETPTHTDRQIEVDIPRCHQYDELLSSWEGHRKFKRILKAWVVSHPQYVYWQGLDSLCAPFLYLNFNNEAQAYACLSAFIPKYLHNFFLKDNSAVIQEYLAKFSHLIAFHDPELANHLASISFIPELFAIPWFLTMFSHVFPLYKILHLWDKLLLGNSSFPLFIGLAILKQLRDSLLLSGFNECILLFSDLPEVDIERCVKDSLLMYNSTPLSICYRQHQLQSNNSDSTNIDLDMCPVPLAELQAETCPRISANDLLQLLHTNSPDTKVIVLDIRPSDDFSRGAVPGSLNIPFGTLNLAEPQLPSGPEANILYKFKEQAMVVVVSSSTAPSAQASRLLVQCGFIRVCILHKGIQVLRSTNILVVPGTI